MQSKAFKSLWNFKRRVTFKKNIIYQEFANAILLENNFGVCEESPLKAPVAEVMCGGVRLCAVLYVEENACAEGTVSADGFAMLGAKSRISTGILMFQISI